MIKLKKQLLILCLVVMSALLSIPTQLAAAAKTNQVEIVVHKLALLPNATAGSNNLLQDYQGIAGAKFAVYDVASTYYQLRAQGVSATAAQKQLATTPPTSAPISDMVTQNTANEQGTAHFVLPKRTDDGREAVYLFRELNTGDSAAKALSQVVALPIYDEHDQELTTIDLYSKNEVIEPPTIEKSIGNPQASYQYGDRINYQLAITVPTDLMNKKQVIIKDENLSQNLALNLSTLKVTQGQSDLTHLFNRQQTAAGFSLTLRDFTGLSQYAGQVIHVNYTATLVEHQDNIVQTDFLNTATLLIDQQPITSQVTIKTGAKKFVKVDLQNQNQKLAGAQFVVKNQAGYYLAVNKGTYYWVKRLDNSQVATLTVTNRWLLYDYWVAQWYL